MADIKKNTDTIIFEEGAYGFTERSGDPTNISNTGFQYVKDLAGVSELFYIDDSGAVTQLTAEGSVAPSHLIEWGSSNVEILSDSGEVVIDTGGTLRFSVDASGNFDLDADGFALDAIHPIILTSTYDNAATPTSIEIKTVTGVNGGAIEVNSANRLILESAEQVTISAVVDVVLGSSTGKIQLSTDDKRFTLSSTGSFDVNAVAYDLDATDVISLTSNWSGGVGTYGIDLQSTHAIVGSIRLQTTGFAGDIYLNSGGRFYLTAVNDSNLTTAGVAWTTAGFDLDSTAPITLTSTYDNATNIYALTLETTVATLGGGSILIDSQNHIHSLSSGGQRLFASGQIWLQSTYDDATTRDSIKLSTASGISGGHIALEAARNVNIQAEDDINLDSHVSGANSSHLYMGEDYLEMYTSGGADMVIRSATRFRLQTATSQRLEISSTGAWDIDGTTLAMDLTGDATINGEAFLATFNEEVIITSTHDVAAEYGISLIHSADLGMAYGILLDSNRMIMLQADNGVYIYTNATPVQRLHIDNLGTWNMDGASVDMDMKGNISMVALGSSTLQATTSINLIGNTSTNCAINIISKGTGYVIIDSDDLMYFRSDSTMYFQTSTSNINRMSIASNGNFYGDFAIFDVDCSSINFDVTGAVAIDATGAMGLTSTGGNVTISCKSTLSGVYLRYGSITRAYFTNAGSYFVGTTSAAVTDLGISGNRLYQDTSSAQWKKDIEDVDEMVADSSEIFNLRPVRYRRKESFEPSEPETLTEEEIAMEATMIVSESERYFFGFIAEEVNEIMPEFVMHDMLTGCVQSLKYNWMVVPLIMELKKSNALIASLTQRLDLLEGV